MNKRICLGHAYFLGNSLGKMVRACKSSEWKEFDSRSDEGLN